MDSLAFGDYPVLLVDMFIVCEALNLLSSWESLMHEIKLFVAAVFYLRCYWLDLRGILDAYPNMLL